MPHALKLHSLTKLSKIRSTARYSTSTLNAGDGPIRPIVPPHKHWQNAPTVSTGIPSISTVLGATQGSTTIGRQGAGVGTPRARAVSAITSGFIGDSHNVKGGIFTIGMMLRILAAGKSLAKTPSGSTINTDGATPKSHSISVPSVATGPGMLHNVT
jgi:hypothetical protein